MGKKRSKSKWPARLLVGLSRASHVVVAPSGHWKNSVSPSQQTRKTLTWVPSKSIKRCEGEFLLLLQPVCSLGLLMIQTDVVVIGHHRRSCNMQGGLSLAAVKVVECWLYHR